MIALDTSIPVYAEQLRRAPSDDSKIEVILSVMPAIRLAGLCLPIHVLAE